MENENAKKENNIIIYQDKDYCKKFTLLIKYFWIILNKRRRNDIK